MDAVSVVLLLFVVAAGAAVLWLVVRRNSPVQPVAPPHRPASGRPASAAPARREAPAAADAPTHGAAGTARSAPVDAGLAAAASAALPAEIASLPWVAADSLPPAQQQRIGDTFRDVPRPPRLLTQLVSLDLMSAASSHELTALVSGEPLIAAKVLAAVNSPAYALSRPVGSIGQAVTFLGLNGVRAICMQYALMQAFQADRPERAQRLAAIWRASAIAGELVQHPMQRLALPDPGGLSSAVVLSHLGAVAVTVGVPAALLAGLPPRDAVACVRAEQQQLGLGAAEIGRLLMQRWELPPALLAEAADIALGLVTPCTAPNDAVAVRQAFAHLCVRLGERLSWGEMTGIADFDLAADTSAELACARSFLAAPGFAALVAQLKAPALAMRVAGLLQGVPAAPGAGGRLRATVVADA